IEETGQKFEHLQGVGRSVDASGIRRILAVGWQGLDVLHAAVVEIAQTAQSVFGRLPVDGVAAAIERGLVRGGVAAIDDAAAVERVGEYLKNRSGYGVLLVDLPEERWAAAILEVVIVVERPHAMAGSTQNAASDNAKAETEEDVEIVAANRFELVFGNSVREAFTQGMYGNRGNIAQQRR